MPTSPEPTSGTVDCSKVSAADAIETIRFLRVLYLDEAPSLTSRVRASLTVHALWQLAGDEPIPDAAWRALDGGV